MVASSIRQLFYVSAAQGALTPATVQSILHASRRNNARVDVTGCLLFSGRLFAQVLEGAPQQVETLATRIARGPRHGQLRVVASHDTTRRSYGNWSMAYLYSLDLEDQLRGLLDGAAEPERAAALMQRMQPDELAGAL